MKNLKTKRSEYIKEYLLENYSIKSKNEIISDLGLSWSYIQKMTHLFGIKREFNESNKSFTCSRLLDYDNLSCYWIGFILADGHISKNNNIQINLSDRDINHISKIKEHIDCEFYHNKENGVIRCTISDKPTILSIKSEFKWSSNKTKNPILIPKFLNENQLFSLIIGFIDGDGSINKNGGITIKCDSSWKSILDIFYEALTNEYKFFKLTKSKCSIIYVNKHSILKDIKLKSINIGLPILKRKWDKISLTRVMKSDKREIVKSIPDYKNMNVVDISNITGFSKSLIYSIKKDRL